jgi:phospholipase C
MQENRSFDSYFGTYPGADGIPVRHGRPKACVPDPLRHRCVRPFHDPHALNYGGPHENGAFTIDLDGGRMDGFVKARQGCTNPLDPPDCDPKLAARRRGYYDMMGYHDAREIPNYWAYARHYVLQDRLFEPASSWSLPAHLFLVSEWSARCQIAGDPMSCTSAVELRAQPRTPPRRAAVGPPHPLARAGVLT